MPLCWARHSTTPCINDRHNIHTPATPIRWKRENIKTQEKKNASGRDSTIALCSICKMYGAAKNSHVIWAGLELLWRHPWSNVEHRPSSNRWPSSCHWEIFLHRSCWRRQQKDPGVVTGLSLLLGALLLTYSLYFQNSGGEAVLVYVTRVPHGIRHEPPN